MKNFNLNSLTVFANAPFTEVTAERYGSPIKDIINRNKLPLRFTDGYDNASMIRIDLEPAASDVKLDKYIGYFDTLKGLYQKMTSRINGNLISIYIPKNDIDRQILSLRTLLESEDYCEYVSKSRELPFVLGETVENQVILEDLAEMPHLLIAGAAGSGKSVALHTLIASLLYYLTPDQLQLVMFDMKMVELSFYDELPYLKEPICIESDKATEVFKGIVKEMQDRLTKMKHARALTLSRYNKIPGVDKIPYLVVVVDEFADLIMSNKDVEKIIASIAQKGRAAGIHLVLSTQRPDANVVTGQIKSNIPARVALTVSNHYDSQIILDESGAELLNKKGDMIFKTSDGVFRLQGAYLTENDIDMIVKSVCSRYGTNSFEEEIVKEVVTEDEIFVPTFKAKQRIDDGQCKDGSLVLNGEFYHTCTAIIEKNRASKSFIRNLWNCGDLKANRYLDRMKDLGVIDKNYVEADKGYPILITMEDFKTNFISEEEANA